MRFIRRDINEIIFVNFEFQIKKGPLRFGQLTVIISSKNYQLHIILHTPYFYRSPILSFPTKIVGNGNCR